MTSPDKEPAFMRIRGRIAAPLPAEPIRAPRRSPEPWVVVAGFVAALAVLIILSLFLGSKS